MENTKEIEKPAKTPITQEWIDSNFTMQWHKCRNIYVEGNRFPKTEFIYQNNDDYHIVLSVIKEDDEDLNFSNGDSVSVCIKNHEVDTIMRKVDTVEAYNNTVINHIRQIKNMLKRYKKEISHLQNMTAWAYDIVKCYGKE